MARARSIKPDFFTDADLTELSPLHRLLFAGLWCHADREGRLEDKPRELKVKVLPFDDCNLDALLADLERKGRIIRYAADGKRVIAVRKFKDHQHCHKDEKPSKLPAPPPVVTTKPPQSFADGVAAMVAPQEHGASTVEAPHRHGATPPLICNRVSVSGSPSSGARSAAARTSPGDLPDRLKNEFERQRGKSYRWNMADELELEKLAQESDDEIARRWSISLDARYRRCSTIADLVRHWNDHSQEQPAGPPTKPRDPSRGYVAAQSQDHGDANGYLDEPERKRGTGTDN